MKSFVPISIRVIDFRMRPAMILKKCCTESVGEVGVPIRFPGDFKRLISNQCMLFELQCN